MLEINSSSGINVQKINTTPDNRQLYSISNPVNNEQINVSVKNEDADSFERSMSAIKKFDENINNPEEKKKNKIKAYAVLLGLGITGIAIPSYLTRNSSKLTKCLSIIGGAALGVIGGFIGFIKCLTPKNYKEVQIAQQTLQGLDIKIENNNA